MQTTPLDVPKQCYHLITNFNFCYFFSREEIFNSLKRFFFYAVLPAQSNFLSQCLPASNSVCLKWWIIELYEVRPMKVWLHFPLHPCIPDAFLGFLFHEKLIIFLPFSFAFSSFEDFSQGFF